jgi:hypothetical protein
MREIKFDYILKYKKHGNIEHHVYTLADLEKEEIRYNHAEVLAKLRGKHDQRLTLFRIRTTSYLYGKGWKFSLSLHNRFFYFLKQYREIRLTVLGLNFHLRVQ